MGVEPHFTDGARTERDLVLARLDRIIELVEDINYNANKIKLTVLQAVRPILNLEELEKRTIHFAMNESGFKKAKAAEKLGISLKTLYNKLDEYQKEEHKWRKANE